MKVVIEFLFCRKNSFLCVIMRVLSAASDSDFAFSFNFNFFFRIFIRVFFHRCGSECLQEIRNRRADSVVKRGNVAEFDLFFCWMDVEIDKRRADRCEKGSDRVRSVREESLAAVFDCLQKRIFLDAPSVHINENAFPVVPPNRRVCDYEREFPVVFSVRFFPLRAEFVQKRRRFFYLKRGCESLFCRYVCGKVQPNVAVNSQFECDVRACERFFDENVLAHHRFACRAFQENTACGKVREKVFARDASSFSVLKKRGRFDFSRLAVRHGHFHVAA